LEASGTAEYVGRVQSQVSGGSPARGKQFSVAASSTIAGQPNSKVAYQWYRNDGAGWLAIIDANQSSFSLTTVAADNGAQFRCNVYIPGATVTSQTATLSIGGTVVQPPAIGHGGAPPPTYNNGTFGLSFTSQNGVSYRVQFKNSLNDANWTDLPNMPIAGNGGVLNVSDSSAGQQARFYRISAQ